MVKQKKRGSRIEDGEWILVSEQLPPQNIAVETKIDTVDGVRNVQLLRYHRGLWWLTDNSMYVYYTPTHWRSC